MKNNKFKLTTIPLIAILTSLVLTYATAADSESVFAWPPKLEDYTPSVPGWKNIYDRRFKQLATASSDDSNERYSVFVVTLHSALLAKNFTEYGWALTKAPQSVTNKLKRRLDAGLKQRDEIVGSVEMDNKSTFFIHDEEQNEEIVKELLPLHEAWSGVKLIPHNSYGLRVYRGETNLNMHVDRTSTHVISSILHVGHGENDEPWPIVIEDFHGNTNEVFLETGDLLFYESSKCFHGRPRVYNGDYYSSLFTHYSPVTDWDGAYEKTHSFLPETYGISQERKANDTYDEAVIDGTSLIEPSCVDNWCALQNSLKWYGPGPGYGKLLTGDGKVTDLEGIPPERHFRKVLFMAESRQNGVVEIGEGDEF